MRISPASRTGLGLTALVLGGVTALLAACGGEGQECRFGADCESGRCSVDGLCLAPGNGTSSGNAGSSGVPGTSSGGSSGSSGTTSSSSGSSGTTSSSSGSSGSSGSCVPNNDGTITKEEAPITAGVVAKYRFANDVTVDLEGELVDGVRRWDFTAAQPGDRDITATTRAVAGSWYASTYPTGQVSGLLGDSRQATCGLLTVTVPSTLAVLRADNDALMLLGVVSNSETEPDSASLTNMAYDKPIPTLKFPLTVDPPSTWKVENAKGTGKLNGATIGPTGNTVTDTYTSRVAGRGIVATPFAVFEVLKVVTTLKRTSTNFCLVNTTTTVAFVSECAGTVAKVTSQNDVDSDVFTDAAELQRITP